MLVINPDEPTEFGTITLDAFYPQIDLNEFNMVMRIGNGSITIARMEFAIKNAFIALENEIADKRAQWANEGYNSLAAVPSNQLGQSTLLVHNWKNALYCLAAAQLMALHSDISATNASYEIDAGLRPQIDELNVVANKSIQDILARPRINCELI